MLERRGSWEESADTQLMNGNGPSGWLSLAKTQAGLIPDEWLPDDPGFDGKAGQREAYLNFFALRLKSSDAFVEEAIRARAAYL